MRIDGVTFLEGAVNENFVIPYTTEYDRLHPDAPPTMGEIVFQVDGEKPGLYVYTGSKWVVGVNANAANNIIDISTLPKFMGDITNDAGSNVLRLVDLPGLNAGSYKQVTVDTTGRVITGSNPTTLDGFGITDAINKSLLPTSGNATNTQIVLGNDTRIGVSKVNNKFGDVTLTFNDFAGKLPDTKLPTIVGLVSGTYNSVTIDETGRVVSAANTAVIDRVNALPTFSASEIGRLIFNTATNKYYFNDGAQWSIVATNADITSAISSQLTTITTDLSTKLDVSNFDKANGYAKVQSNNKIDSTLIPVVPITNTTVANTQAEVTAKIAAALPGDVIIDNVTGQSLIKMADGTAVPLSTPTDVVTSINGKRGNIAKISLLDTTGIVDTNNKLISAIIPEFSGDVQSTGTNITLKNVATAGTYTSVTINAKGQVTGGTNGVSYTKIETDAKLDLKVDSSNFDKANGYAKVQSNNKINSSLIPAVPITDTTVANTPAELSAQIASALPGDVIIDNTTGKSLIKLADGTAVPLTTPTDTVTSINGKKGIIDKINIADTTGFVVNGKLDPTLFPVLTGDIENTGLSVALKNITAPGTYTSVTVNAKGLITGGTTGAGYTKDEIDALLLGKEKLTNKDLDVTLAANSDDKYPTQKAVKTYVDSSISTFAATFGTLEDFISQL